MGNIKLQYQWIIGISALLPTVCVYSHNIPVTDQVISFYVSDTLRYNYINIVI